MGKPRPPESSREALRRLALSRVFAPASDVGAAIHAMGFVQADPIRAPARAQDLILRQRVEGYRAGDLEAQYASLGIDEGRLHVYGFMPSATWELLRGRNMPPPTAFERAIFEAVRASGPTHPRDLDEEFGTEREVNDWGGTSRSTKRALEQLHRRGWLRIATRERGVRVYEVAPPREAVDPVAALDALIALLVRVLAPARLRLVHTLVGGIGKALADRTTARSRLKQALDDGRLQAVRLDGVDYVLPAADGLDDVGADEAGAADEPDGVGADEERLRILTPFDPLVFDRDRFEQLWGWAYRFEAYTPAAQRSRGYYAMPLLWRGEMLGWANLTLVGAALDVDLGFVEGRPRDAAFERALEAELASLREFLGV
jgi:uncharacterized protein YcaQ